MRNRCDSRRCHPQNINIAAHSMEERLTRTGGREGHMQELRKKNGAHLLYSRARTFRPPHTAVADLQVTDTCPSLLAGVKGWRLCTFTEALIRPQLLMQAVRLCSQAPPLILGSRTSGSRIRIGHPAGCYPKCGNGPAGNSCGAATVDPARGGERGRLSPV